jgi:hypothetical protein
LTDHRPKCAEAYRFSLSSIPQGKQRVQIDRNPKRRNGNSDECKDQEGRWMDPAKRQDFYQKAKKHDYTGNAQPSFHGVL